MKKKETTCTKCSKHPAIGREQSGVALCEACVVVVAHNRARCNELERLYKSGQLFTKEKEVAG